jgi:hypothetical protein
MGFQEISGLWIKEGKTDKEGNKYCTGKVRETITIEAGQTVFMYKNARKTQGDKFPDYRIVLATDDDMNQAAAQDNSSDDIGF